MASRGLRVAFADESGTGPEFSCYAIGVLSFAADRQEHFVRVFHQLHQRHGVVGEFKWGKIASSHGAINLALDWLDRILRSRTATFDVIVVRKDLYRYWSSRGADRESAFYRTYTYLLRHVARRVRCTTEVFIDDRSDSYERHTEVVETVGNRMLAQLHGSGRLGAVTKVSSASCPAIQVADVLTGAFTAAHQLYLNPTTRLHPGKRLAIARVAMLIGWDDLRYDTFPHEKLNVWHFPSEFRADPESRPILPSSEICYVSKEDLAAARTAG